MGFFSRFSKKKNEEDLIPERQENKPVESDELLTVIDARDIGRTGRPAGSMPTPPVNTEPEFIFGVETVSPVPESMDLLATGKLKGTIRIGDAVFFSNPGDDTDLQAHYGEVIDIYREGQQVDKAVNGRGITLRIEKGAELPIRPATVGHPRDVSDAAVRTMYTSRLGDIYVVAKDLELSEGDLRTLSITDLQEIWRLFIIYHTQMIHGETEERVQANKQKLNRIVNALCIKILQSDSVYCLYNRKTGEPHLFSSTMDRGDGSYMCTPPVIRICTESYRAGWESSMPDCFELRRIELGADKQGVYNFFGSAFYLNGACGVQIISPNTVADKAMLVPEPDLSGVPAEQIPVTNPNLVRWMLLIGQMGAPKTEEAKKTFGLYYQFESQELVKANFLIPVQDTEMDAEPDGTGRFTLEEGKVLKFPVIQGKNGRMAVRMFTDWKRLRMVYGEEWGGIVQPVGGMIDAMDCAVNATACPAAGCYVSRDAFERMVNKFGAPASEPAAEEENVPDEAAERDTDVYETEEPEDLVASRVAEMTEEISFEEEEEETSDEENADEGKDADEDETEDVREADEEETDGGAAADEDETDDGPSATEETESLEDASSEKEPDGNAD